MVGQHPRVSFGVPVRNGEASIGRCLDSILGQTLEDFEVIVSDNASTDSTCGIVDAYAARDSRVRLSVHPENVGLIENFNHVARLAGGEFFRWVGADDWIEATCAAECVEALDAQPESIVATSYFDLERENGKCEYLEYEGEFLDSPDPVRRLERMLWFFHAGAAVYEPNYSMIRRRVLMETGLLRIHRKNDWLLSTQLALAGPFVHVPKLLFHRWWPAPSYSDILDLPKRLHPTRQKELGISSFRLLKGLLSVLSEAELSAPQRRACQRRVFGFCATEASKAASNRVRRFRRQRLGLTRDRFIR